MRIAIAGAGIAGLAANYWLRKLGHDVSIFEASERAGGRGRLLNRPGTNDWADVGTQYFHSDYRLALSLIDDLGLSPKLKAIDGKTRMFYGDGQQSFMLNPRVPWMKPGGLWGNIQAAIYIAKLLAGNKTSAYEAAQSQSRLDRVSALSSVSNQFVRDYIVRMLTLVGGLNEPAFSNVSLLQIYRLIRIILTTEYLSLEGGTAALHAALASEADINFNRAASGIIETKDGVAGLVLADGTQVEADHVIIATQAPHAESLLPESWHAERNYLAGIDMPPALIVSFFLDRSLEDGVWSYFFPMEKPSTVTFCVDTHQKSPTNTPSGKATLQAWILNPQSNRLMNKTDENVADVALLDIERYMPGLSSSVEGYVVTRHQHAVPQATVGHNQETLAFLAQIDRRTGISFCGDYLSGGYVECALWSARRAVERITETRTRAGLSARPLIAA